MSPLTQGLNYRSACDICFKTFETAGLISGAVPVRYTDDQKTATFNVYT